MNFSARRAAFLRKMNDLAWKMAVASAPGSDAQKLWYDSYVRLGDYKDAGVALEDLLTGKRSLPGLTLDQDRRWTLIEKLSAAGAPDAAKLRKAERSRDPSESGELAAIAAEASTPTREAKTTWYAEILNPKSKRSLAQLKAAMRGLFPPEQAWLRTEWANRYYADLAANGSRDREFLNAFASNLVPATCTDISAQTLKDFIDHQQRLQPMVAKRLKIAQQEDQQCANIRRIAADAPAAGG
jgi:aminopeptidase N